MITYKATNTLNGRFYIGSTTDLEKRKQQHLSSTANYPFQNALQKNPEAFEWETIEDTSDNPILEQALLDMWFGTEMCYNLCPHAGRPQFNLESVRKWGETNGPIQGRRRLIEKTGIFAPDAPKSDWAKKGGQVTAERHSNPVRIFLPNGDYVDFKSLKQAIAEGPLSYGTLKRLVKDPKRTSRSGHTARLLNHVC